jgi:hypothetical protein
VQNVLVIDYLTHGWTISDLPKRDSVKEREDLLAKPAPHLMGETAAATVAILASSTPNRIHSIIDGVDNLRARYGTRLVMNSEIHHRRNRIATHC